MTRTALGKRVNPNFKELSAHKVTHEVLKPCGDVCVGRAAIILHADSRAPMENMFSCVSPLCSQVTVFAERNILYYVLKMQRLPSRRLFFSDCFNSACVELQQPGFSVVFVCWWLLALFLFFFFFILHIIPPHPSHGCLYRTPGPL